PTRRILFGRLIAALDRPGHRFLGEVIGVTPKARHAVANRPHAPSVPFDGGKHVDRRGGHASRDDRASPEGTWGPSKFAKRTAAKVLVELTKMWERRLDALEGLLAEIEEKR